MQQSPLDGLVGGHASPVDIQAGALPPAARAGAIGPAGMMAPVPGGGAMLIANAPDGTLYHYEEGMMAPSGSFSNQGRVPRALMVLDRGLRETAPGVFSAPVRPMAGGSFVVPVVMDQPRLIRCFDVEVAGREEGATAPGALRIVPLFPREPLEARTPATLEFRAVDAASGEDVSGIRDMNILVLQPPGVWQWRSRVTETGGVFRFRLTLPRPGQYRVLCAAPSRGLRLTDAPHASVMARDGNTAPFGPSVPK